MNSLPETQSTDVTLDHDPTPEEKANIFSQLLFSWLSPLFKTGYKRRLEIEDLNFVRKEDYCDFTVKQFYKKWRAQIKYAMDANAQANANNIKQPTDVNNEILEGVGNMHMLGRQSSDQASAPSNFVGTTNIIGDHQPSLGKAIFWAFCVPQYVMVIPLKLVSDCLQMSGPVILYYFLRDAKKFEHSDHGENTSAVNRAYILSALLFGSVQLSSLIMIHFWKIGFRTGMRIRSALTAACYEKALKLSIAAKTDKTTGKIINIFSSDVRKIRDLMSMLPFAVSAPFQIIISLYLLYQQIYWCAFMGMAVNLFLVVPLQGFSGKKVYELTKALQSIKDERLKIMSSVFSSMNVVKMYAWERSFNDKITEIRERELAKLKSLVKWMIAMWMFFVFAPNMILLGSFTAYTMAGYKLTAAKAFTSIALFELLRWPMAMLPWVIGMLLEALVSLKRLREFLASNEIQSDVIEFSDEIGDHLILLEDASFSWDDAQNLMALKDINCAIKRNTITMIIGETGSGKSALLSAILGEITKTNGKIIYAKSLSLAYSSQVAWIRNATLRDNILFGKEYSKEYYEKVIYACALTDDLKILAGGDQTEIGEKGINLSGGQKQRVSLARAVYASADVYILDDVLSAVDSEVAKHIFDECLLGLLADKTVIMATHAMGLLKHAHNILLIEPGDGGAVIQMQGTLQELVDAKVNLTKFALHGKDDGDDDDDDVDDDDDTKHDDDDDVNDVNKKTKLRRKSIDFENRESQIKKEDLKKAKAGALVEEAEREVGMVTWRVYSLYIAAAGGMIYFLLYMAFLIAQNGVAWFSIFWMAIWADTIDDDDVDDRDDNENSVYFLSIYAILQVGTMTGYTIPAIIMMYRRLAASKLLHSQLLNKMFSSPMSFFDTTPIGRIINRFSSDINAVDNNVPKTLEGVLAMTIGIIGIFVGVCVVTPYFAICIIPLSVLYWYIEKYFISTQRELKRLSNILNSPIFSNFSESITGASIIRAFAKTKEFCTKNRNLIDGDHQAYYPSIMGNRWLAIRLETIGNVFIGGAAFSCAITRPSAGYVGIALATTMSLAVTLNWLVRQKAELEQDIVAVERIDQYSNDKQPQEKVLNESEKIEISDEWPVNGEISFSNVFMKYRPELDYVLNGLTFDVNAGEKIGVIGRTGAGKSSLFLTLLRLIEIDEKMNGKVMIDDVDVSKISLYDLRSRISVIPQDPVLFIGDIRFNLDPFGVKNDDEMIDAIKSAHCYDALMKIKNDLEVKFEKDKLDKEMREEEKKENEKKGKNKKKDKDDQNKKDKDETSLEGEKETKKEETVIEIKEAPKTILDIEVEEDGGNLSVGQRQLICLARAIVRGSKILLLDEATSAVDPQTDQNIQQTIRSVFSECTILTIAHRIDTILDYDRILIMDNGSVLEYDTPSELLSNKNSKFSEIVKSSFGVELDQILKAKFNTNDDDNDEEYDDGEVP